MNNRRTEPDRPALPFRSVNRLNTPSYDPGLQRHHILPRQLRQRRFFARLFAAIDSGRMGFEDFRRNGMLLPAKDESAVRLALPLHRGPHRIYNELVIERVGQIEAAWARARPRCLIAAGEDALFRLDLLQRALRRRLLAPPRRPLLLNRNDPLGKGFDFSGLDAMADSLWGATQGVLAASSASAA